MHRVLCADCVTQLEEHLCPLFVTVILICHYISGRIFKIIFKKFDELSIENNFLLFIDF